jgi:hypothetical protein
MRATALRHFAPHLRRGTCPEPSALVPRELMPQDAQETMRAAFDGVAAEQALGKGTRKAVDPWSPTGMDAFLLLEGERQALVARLPPRWRSAKAPLRPETRKGRRGDRYRDLIVIASLTRSEHDYLAGRIVRDAGAPPPPNGASDPGANTSADWIQFWALAVMRELRAMCSYYARRRDRLARWLGPSARASAAADAKLHLEEVARRFESVSGDWLEFEDDRVSARGSAEANSLTEPAREGKAVGELRRWPSSGLTRAVALVGAALLVAAVGTILGESRRGGPSPSASARTGAAVRVPKPAFAEPRNVSRDPGGRASKQGSLGSPSARDRLSQDDVGGAPPAPSGTGAGTRPTAAETAPPAPQPTPEAASAPAPAPAPTSAPDPTTAPDPDPKPDPVSPLPDPDPVSSLPDPDPVSSLPDPGSGG